MAEFVQQSIEEMVGELHEMQTAGLFDGSEIRYILFPFYILNNDMGTEALRLRP